MLMGMFSEHPCFTGNSVSSEHPPCFHYFGLAQPTTDKQIEERTRRSRFVKYLFIFKRFINSLSYSAMSKTSAVWQCIFFIKIENVTKVECKVCKQQFVYHSSTTNMAYHLKAVS